nr:hypothetical protein [uncultured Psychrobacter sp.]
MYNTHHSLYSYLTSMSIFRVLISIVCVTLLFSSQSSYAATDNPGATCQGITGAAQGSLTTGDYTNLVSSTNNNRYVNIAGNGSGAIPLQIRMTRVESSEDTILSSFESFSAAGRTAINMKRNFPTVSDYTDINFEFRNSGTQQPLFLSNVAISAFDIDYANSNGNRFYDYVKFTGVNAAGNEILSVQQNISGSFIANYQQEGLFTGGSNGRAFNCPARNLGTECQGSIQFPEPVKSVKIRYTNTGTLIQPPTTPTSQEVDVTIDNYCYVPPASSYDISKDDGVSSIGTNNTTNYKIKVVNTGGTTLSNINLKDPLVTGLSKQSNITCDTNDSTNICSTRPTIAQLEGNGFTIPSIPVGKSYSIVVPTTVTAASGSTVTNTATISHATLATKSDSDSNTVTSIFDGGSSNTPATCPSGHKMYYIGANPPSFSPINSQPLNWTSGNTSRTFTFTESAGNKTFLISFANLRNLNNSAGNPPYFGSVNGVTTSAINLRHNSPTAETNHELNISINRTISKTGYKIQDLDSTIVSSQVPYAEQVNVSTNGGQLTFDDVFHTINSGRNIVTAIRERNCGVGECTIDATWGYNTANTPLNLKHINTFTERNSPHAIGYSDFYFCLAPPQIIVNKLLDGSRVDGDDQFRIELRRTDNNAFVQAFTTTGSDAVVTDNTTTITTLTEGVNYTVSEQIINGNLLDYKTTYTCSNATTGTNVVFSSGEMPVNAASTRRTFAINNVGYGDEITCNVTNTPSVYTFSGTVFNDNGGITDAQADANNANISSGIYANTNYFNGVFNTPPETGIAGSTVKLVNCATPSTVYATQAVSATGTYQISAPATTINGNSNNICLVEERVGTDYPIRTTPPSKKINIVANTLSYPNNDFGRVIAENVALVLKKSQYINDCPATLNYASINDAPTPLTGFSTAMIEGIAPGRCIAYKITATNRANIKIDNFIMDDVLQKKGTAGAPVTSVLANPALDTADYNISSSPAIGANGIVTTKSLVLPPRSKRDFYFNTKYSTSQ